MPIAAYEMDIDVLACILEIKPPVVSGERVWVLFLGKAQFDTWIAVSLDPGRSFELRALNGVYHPLFLS